MGGSLSSIKSGIERLRIVEFHRFLIALSVLPGSRCGVCVRVCVCVEREKSGVYVEHDEKTRGVYHGGA